MFMPRYTVGWLNAIHRARSDTRVVEPLIDAVEALDFEAGSDERFDRTHPGKVLLHRSIDSVQALLHLAEQGKRPAHNKKNST